MQNGVQLITYVDRFGGGDLSTLKDLLTGPLDGVFTGVHILPFYRPFDRADAGFDPIDHRSVDPRLGDWDRIRAIAATHDVTADLIVNHISDESPQFVDYIEKGADSPFDGMFLTFGAGFPEGATEADLLRIYRPRPNLPFTVLSRPDGSREVMWTTFTAHQIDLDVDHPETRSYLKEILDRLELAGVSQIRLDAIGYAVKTPGTSCFMTPDTQDFIKDLSAEVRARGMESLLEIHSHYADQLETAGKVDRVYDFALPPLVLQAIQTGSARTLRRWLEISPRNAISVLDTHDGIGIVDVGPSGDRPGLLSATEVDGLVEGIHRATGGESRHATGEAASNLDLYQVNSTFFSAVGGVENDYLLARLAQFLAPGIPQVYYAGLLAARNDMQLLGKSGVGRDINRPYFSAEDIEQRLRLPVVQRLIRLIAFRNTHPAFQGEFELGPDDAAVLTMSWRAEGSSITARIDFKERTFVVDAAHDGAGVTITDWDSF